MVTEVRLSKKGVRSLREWGRILHPAGGDVKTLVVFKAYLDESGIHGDSKVCVMAAYLAPEKEWARFIPKWQGVLDRHGINVFHAKECKNNRGEFAKFRGKRDEKNAFVSELLSTVGTRKRIVPLFAGVMLDDFTDEFREAIGSEAKHPWFTGLISVMTYIGLWMHFAKWPKSEKVALLCDRQDRFSEHAMTVFNQALDAPYFEGQERFGAFGFGERAKDIPLQAADALAFDSYHEFNRRYYHPEQEPRTSFKILSKGIPGWIWDREENQEFISRKAERKTRDGTLASNVYDHARRDQREE
jgi:hypothetical protein